MGFISVQEQTPVEESPPIVSKERSDPLGTRHESTSHAAEPNNNGVCNSISRVFPTDHAQPWTQVVRAPRRDTLHENASPTLREHDIIRITIAPPRQCDSGAPFASVPDRLCDG